MKQQEIRVFLAIAKYKTISAAAAALHYAQPTVSGYLDQLEKSMGVQLVKRTKGKRGVDLTPAGMEFLHLARQYEDMERRFVQFAKEHQRGTLRLAASVVSHQYIVCHLTQKLLRTVPDVEIRLSTLELKDLVQAMEEHTFDVAIAYDYPDHPIEIPPHIKEIPLFREEYCILCPADTTLPDRPLAPEELDPAFEIVQEGYANQQIQQWRNAHGLGEAKPFFKASSMLSVHTYLTDPRCWGFVLSGVAFQMAETHPETLTVRHVLPAPEDRSCNALILAHYPEDTVVSALLRCMEEYIAERPFLKRYI